ncbi:MAG: Rrf2 family transcriptional regulator [Synechococcaceae cyanobacterium]
MTFSAKTFSAKTEYGLVALIELAGVEPPERTLQVGEICRRQGIPARYLDQMLTSLRKAGLLRSIRGPRGGYRLARPPAEITVAEVIACLERSTPAERQGDRSTVEFSVVSSLEKQVEQARARLLSATTLQQLLEERQARAEPSQMFYI